MIIDEEEEKVEDVTTLRESPEPDTFVSIEEP
jgi:hypothetical protein